MKLKEGMYVRYEGLINKIIEIDDDYLVFDQNWYDHWADEVSSMKYDRFVNDYKPIASHNILALIEPMDLMYVDISPDDCGGIVVPRVAETLNELKEWKERISNGSCILKGVVTREQLVNMRYWVY